jgi:hypothetical protein
VIKAKPRDEECCADGSCIDAGVESTLFLMLDGAGAGFDVVSSCMRLCSPASLAVAAGVVDEKLRGVWMLFNFSTAFLLVS